MAIIEFQFRKSAFLNYFKAEINRRRLPFPTLDIITLPQVKGHLLEQIECIDCTTGETSGEGQIIVQVKLAIHYHTSLATIQAAGSLKRAVTERAEITFPVLISINLINQPDGTKKPQLQWSSASGLFSPGVLPMDLPDGINIQSAAVEANTDTIAIRLGSQPDDPVNAPVTNRLGNSEWVQLVSGQFIAEQLRDNLSTMLGKVLSSDIELSKAPTGEWVTIALPIVPWKVPYASASAEVNAIDQCILDIDISVALSLVLEFAASGHTLVSTLNVFWDADSTLCDTIGTLLLTPIGGIAIHVIAEDKASETILGKASTPDKFKKIGATDDSITYQSTANLLGPSDTFIVTGSEMNAEGLRVSGDIRNKPLPLGLSGGVSAATSGLHTDCHKKSVTVQFNPAELFLNDIGMDGPPRLLPPGILYNPAGAWIAVPFASNSWLDLALNFIDPPGGRLPAGTATSIIINTDCGVRWVDLGLVPHQHALPTEGDMIQMISKCMAKSDPWANGKMHLDWLVDPPNLLHEFDPVRQWTIDMRELPENTHLRFLAMDTNGRERTIGEVRGHRNLAVQLTSNANESLLILTSHHIVAPAPAVYQRWIVPFASVPLQEESLALSASEGIIGVREPGGKTLVIDLATAGVATAHHINSERPSTPVVQQLMTKLSRQEKRERAPWASAAQIDRETVAVVHGEQLLIGRLGKMTKM